MARPSEGLGDAFSCRLPVALDEAARRERDTNGTPLSVTVRRWLKSRHKQETKRLKNDAKTQEVAS